MPKQEITDLQYARIVVMAQEIRELHGRMRKLAYEIDTPASMQVIEAVVDLANANNALSWQVGYATGDIPSLPV